jgi:para-aminobenzoate synthetase / 4-amino-4-deoxychorismate lyase
VPDRVRPDRASGVFETLLIRDGTPVELDAHLERLHASVRALFGVEPPAGVDELARARCASLALGRLRLTAAPRDGAGGGAIAVDVLTAAVDADDLFPTWERAVALRPVTIAGGLGAHKWVDRSRLAAAGASDGDGRLGLVLDAGGDVLEAVRANVFAVERDVLLTPVADGRILPGVTRARTIEAARSLAIDVREEPFGLERLIAAGEVFLTGSIRGLEPVRAVGEAELAPPGDAVAALANELRGAWLGVGAGDWALAR